MTVVLLTNSNAITKPEPNPMTKPICFSRGYQLWGWFHRLIIDHPSTIKLSNPAMSSPQIPIVNFTPFLDGSAKQQVADQLLASFKSAGFVYITNIGILEEEVQEMFDWVGQPF
jgi:hypothetical protein